MAMETKVASALGAELGEGPVWVERDEALWFVDIKKHEIHRFDPVPSFLESWKAPDQVSFIFPAERGGFVVGLPSGLFHFDETNGTFDAIAKIRPEHTSNRLNDGIVDPEGRLWFGTMDNAEKAKTGAFYCFVDGKIEATEIHSIAITNGPAVSPDGRMLYFVDTLKGTIGKAEIASDGSLSHPEPFVRIDPKHGHPDGPTIDSEGCLWIALYAGWEARRYSPQGELLATLRFPVANITKLAFGGAGLCTGFATTARQGLSQSEIAKQSAIGDLFTFTAKIPGIPCPSVRY